LEILIIDNDPPDDASASAFRDVVGDDPRFHYVLEPQRGLSRARNRALEVASGQIVAFTDDDVRVDPHWIAGVRLGFGRAPDVGCVTGLVATASLTTRAEQYFDARVWWSSSCTQRSFREARGPNDPVIHPFSAGLFGTGANMAFRRDLMIALGGFDEAFGAGSPTGGPEDLDAFVRVVRSGYALSYEPSALVWHEHRSTDEALQRQMYGYGRGLSAYIVKYLTQRDTVGPVLRRAPRALWHLITLQKRSEAAASESRLPREVLRSELKGFLVGPATYLKARLQGRKRPLPRLPAGTRL
jgi:GT2 family glycosyltransferase